MVSGNDPAGKHLLSVLRSREDCLLIAAQHKVGISSIGGRLQEQRRKISAYEVVAVADPLQFGRPADSGAVAEDEIARVKNRSIFRVARGKIQRMGVDEKYTSGFFIAIADEIFQ